MKNPNSNNVNVAASVAILNTLNQYQQMESELRDIKKAQITELKDLGFKNFGVQQVLNTLSSEGLSNLNSVEKLAYQNAVLDHAKAQVYSSLEQSEVQTQEKANKLAGLGFNQDQINTLANSLTDSNALNSKRFLDQKLNLNLQNNTLDQIIKVAGNLKSEGALDTADYTSTFKEQATNNYALKRNKEGLLEVVGILDSNNKLDTSFMNSEGYTSRIREGINQLIGDTGVKVLKTGLLLTLIGGVVGGTVGCKTSSVIDTPPVTPTEYETLSGTTDVSDSALASLALSGDVRYEVNNKDVTKQFGVPAELGELVKGQSTTGKLTLTADTYLKRVINGQTFKGDTKITADMLDNSEGLYELMQKEGMLANNKIIRPQGGTLTISFNPDLGKTEDANGNLKRLPGNYIAEVKRVFNKVKDLSNGVIQQINYVDNGNELESRAAKSGEYLIFMNTTGEIGNGSMNDGSYTYGGVIKINSNKSTVFGRIEAEVPDSFYPGNQDFFTSRGWTKESMYEAIAFSFKRDSNDSFYSDREERAGGLSSTSSTQGYVRTSSSDFGNGFENGFGNTPINPINHAPVGPNKGIAHPKMQKKYQEK